MFFRSSRARAPLARRLAPVVASVAFGALSLVVPRLAQAQSITIFQANSLPRFDASGNQVGKRAQGLNPEGVSYQDCVDDQRIKFTLQLAGFAANAALEVWAGVSGNDCADQNKRIGPAATCWQLATGIPLQLQVDSVIPVRNIMAGAKNPQNRDSSAAICGQIDRTNVTVNFLYFAPGNPGTPAVRQPIDISVDTIGPPALSGVRVLPGNTRLNVQWDSVGEGGVQDLVNVRVFCAPTGAPQETTETVCNDPVTVTDDAGNDAGTEDAGCTTRTTTKSACSEAAFATGADGGQSLVPDKAFVDKFLCGELAGATGAGVTARSVQGQPLQNNRDYAVAVAGTDSFGNGGALSPVVCNFPEQTTDFWSEYKGAGGEAGGGFCSTQAAGGAAGSGVMAGVAALSLVSIIRRRAQKRARSGGAR